MSDFPEQPPALPASPPVLPVPVVSQDDRMLGMLCHLLSIFTGFLGPLIVWLVKRDTSRFVAHHGAEALNFQITVMLAMLALGVATLVLMFVLIGVFLVPVIWGVGIFALVVEIIATVAASRGEWYRYPACLRLVPA